MTESAAEIEFRTTLATSIVTYAEASWLIRDLAGNDEVVSAGMDRKTALVLASNLDDECAVRWKAYMSYSMLRYGLDIRMHFHPKAKLDRVLEAVKRTEDAEHPPGLMEKRADDAVRDLGELAVRMNVPLPAGFGSSE